MFIYEPILIKIPINANIKKTQFFCKRKYDLEGDKRSKEVILKIQNYLFLLDVFLTPNLLKTFNNVNIMKTQFFHEMKYTYL